MKKLFSLLLSAALLSGLLVTGAAAATLQSNQAVYQLSQDPLGTEPFSYSATETHSATLVPVGTAIQSEGDGLLLVEVFFWQWADGLRGLVIGTVSYIAPELVTKGHADARSDVYSLGIVLYEMLTGRKPHTGDSPIQVAYSHVHNQVPPPSARPAWRCGCAWLGRRCSCRCSSSASCASRGWRPARRTRRCASAGACWWRCWPSA